MLLLGIDTSCDDTSAGVVADGRVVLSSVVHSQVAVHRPHGGVVPELASREHIRNILPVVQEALKQAGKPLESLDGVAVTVGPGLVGALLVGLYYAKGLYFVHGMPLIPVNHLEGHILSIFLEEDCPDFPFVVLTVSGGHTNLYHVSTWGSYTLLGQTLDDAAGEAFDKVAKMTGLGYPGGRPIENLSLSGQRGRIPFPRAYLSSDSLDFSFSGVKTAVSLYLKKWQEQDGFDASVTLADIVASFQEAVVDVLVHKALLAQEKTRVHSIVLAGGVACNKRLRDRMSEAFQERGVRVYYPRPAYCTDNGAMIAVAGYHGLVRGERAELDADVRSRFPVPSTPLGDHCLRAG